MSKSALLFLTMLKQIGGVNKSTTNYVGDLIKSSLDSYFNDGTPVIVSDIRKKGFVIEAEVGLMSSRNIYTVYLPGDCTMLKGVLQGRLREYGGRILLTEKLLPTEDDFEWLENETEHIGDE